MEFPDFFKLTKVNEFIKSSRWRGMALLSSPMNNGAQVDMISAATGDLFTDRDTALHIVNKPMKVITITPTTGGVTALAAKVGIRYYIHGIFLSARLIAADTTTATYVSGTQDGTVTIMVIVNIVPSVASAINYFCTPDVLLDENTAVTGTCSIANPTAGQVTIYYAEVGAK